MYVSLTSGDVSEQVKATLDAAGGMPMLRGAIEAMPRSRGSPRWEARRGGAARRRAAACRVAGARVDARAPGAPDATLDPLARAASGHGPLVAPSERESLERLRRGGPARDGLAVRSPRRTARTGSSRRGWSSAAGAVALKLDAEGLAHKSEAGGVALGLGDEPAIRAAVARAARATRRHRPASPFRGLPRGADGRRRAWS